ncbi:MAG TPA: AraC family transcriptional regulator [Phycisphaerae bacterium]|nr:AraC family transcriptional regulator [Phycisphaerae bacterium]
MSQFSTLHVEGRSPVRLAPDEFVICSTHMRGVWTVDRGYTTSAIHIEEPLMNRYLPNPGRFVGQRLDLPLEFCEILHRVMDAGLANAGTARFGWTATNLIGSFLQILALAPKLAGSERSAEHTSLALRRGQIKGYIRRNFSDPDLSISSIAEHFGFTPRYLQKVFSAEEIGPHEYLRRCRLDASSRMLHAGEYVEKGITEIAFECGFGSSAHFSSEFRRHFGVSPREFRKKH